MKFAALFLIRIYQALHGSFFSGTCRFYPTCSQYAVEAIETRGVGQGMVLSVWRILRCQPFCKGGWDPVPPLKGWDKAPASHSENLFRSARRSPIPFESLEPMPSGRAAATRFRVPARSLARQTNTSGVSLDQ